MSLTKSSGQGMKEKVTLRITKFRLFREEFIHYLWPRASPTNEFTTQASNHMNPKLLHFYSDPIERSSFTNSPGTEGPGWKGAPLVESGVAGRSAVAAGAAAEPTTATGSVSSASSESSTSWESVDKSSPDVS